MKTKCRISLEDQNVSLDKPFANGLACKFPQVTINASDIQVLLCIVRFKQSTPQELKILKSKADVEAEQNASSFTSTVNTEPSVPIIVTYGFWIR